MLDFDAHPEKDAAWKIKGGKEKSYSTYHC